MIPAQTTSSFLGKQAVLTAKKILLFYRKTIEKSISLFYNSIIQQFFENVKSNGSFSYQKRKNAGQSGKENVMSSKRITISIQNRSYAIQAPEDEAYLNKLAAQLDYLITDAAKTSPNSTFIEQLILVGLEQQDQIYNLKKEIETLKEESDHRSLGEGLGCIADYRDAIALLNQRCDALKRENDALSKQLEQTFEALSRLAGQKGNT
jgi:cell division protein ZapA (FtsZ GTPase activity inhibitor)